MKIEKALQCRNIKSIQGIKGFQRVYYGEEFCERLLPKPNELKKILQDVRHMGKSFSLITPFSTDKGISALRGLFKVLSPQDEIVVNDYGVLNMVNEEFGNPVFIGRILGKQILAAVRVKNKQEIKEYFSIFGPKIEGLEVDYHNYQQVSQTLRERMCISFNRSPFYWGVTRRCVFSPNFSTLSKFGECNKECLKTKAIIHNKLINKDFLVEGNQIMNMDKVALDKKIGLSFLSRIVFKVKEK